MLYGTIGCVTRVRTRQYHALYIIFSNKTVFFRFPPPHHSRDFSVKVGVATQLFHSTTEKHFRCSDNAYHTGVVPLWTHIVHDTLATGLSVLLCRAIDFMPVIQ